MADRPDWTAPLFRADVNSAYAEFTASEGSAYTTIYANQGGGTAVVQRLTFAAAVDQYYELRGICRLNLAVRSQQAEIPVAYLALSPETPSVVLSAERGGIVLEPGDELTVESQTQEGAGAVHLQATMDYYLVNVAG